MGILRTGVEIPTFLISLHQYIPPQYFYYCNTRIAAISAFSSSNCRYFHAPRPCLWTRTWNLILPCGSFGGESRGYCNGHKVGVSQVLEMLEVTPWEIKHPPARYPRRGEGCLFVSSCYNLRGCSRNKTVRNAAILCCDKRLAPWPTECPTYYLTHRKAKWTAK